MEGFSVEKKHGESEQAFKPETERENLLSLAGEAETGAEEDFAYLEPLKNDRDPPSLLQLLTLSAVLVKETFLVASAYVGPFVFNASLYKFLGTSSDSRTQAAFGISSSFQMVFFSSFIFSAMDKIGIATSQMLGAKDFAGYRQKFWQGVVSTWTIYFGATLPLFLFSGAILSAIGIEEETASLAQGYLRRILPVIGMETVSQLVRTFCVAQGHESYFGKISLANTIICIIIGYYLIVVKNQGLWGSVVLKGIYESVHLLTGAIKMKFGTHPETRGLSTFKAVGDGLCEYFTDMIKFVLGTYTEFLGFEITTLFIAKFHDNDEIFAYAASASLVNGCYNVGMALSLIGRTRINYLIGQQKQAAAKTLFIYMHRIGMVIGVICGIVVFSNAQPLAVFLTGTNAAAAVWMEKIVRIYCFFLASEFSIYLSFIGMKSIGRIVLLLILNLVFAIFGNLLGCTILSHFGYRSPQIFISLYFLNTVTNALSFLFTVLHDWSTVKE